MWKKKHQTEEEKEREKIRKIVSMYQREMEVPEDTEVDIDAFTKEFKTFMEEEESYKKSMTIYEKLCDFAGKTFTVKPDGRAEKRLNDATGFCYMNTNATGVYSLAFMTGFLLLCIVIILAFFIKSPAAAVLAILAFVSVPYLIYKHPEEKAKRMRVESASESILAILYMVIAMRMTPNLENAVKFAAVNLSGPLSYDFRKMVWDVEMRKYKNFDDAIGDYVGRYKIENDEFSRALHMIKSSMGVEYRRRLAMLDESLKLILEGTRTRMNRYSRSLKMPVTLINAMGIMLPVMGLIMFPLLVIFMANSVKPVFLLIGYDILLPLFLFWYMNRVLASKPPTFSQPDVKSCKEIPPMGKFRMGERNLPVIPFALVISLPLLLIGSMGFLSEDMEIFQETAYSMVFVWGIGLFFISYCFLDSYQKMKLRDDIGEIEKEFPDALFQLGNQLSSGLPIEKAVERATVNIKEMKICRLFDITIRNMKKLGMTFEQALFDTEWGAIWAYPSKIIKSVFQAVTESAKKSVKVASLSMLTIASYLNDMKAVKEEIAESLDEPCTSMKFLSNALCPLVAGVTVTMAIIIMSILVQIGGQLSSELENADMRTNVMSGILLTGWGQGGQGMPISPAGFQFIVGLYMIETSIIISIFTNSLYNGSDEIGVRYLIARTLLVSLFVYSISWAGTFILFGDPISSFMTPQ